jgi:hypothetical protein
LLRDMQGMVDRVLTLPLVEGSGSEFEPTI